ncbi:MAG: ribonuclease III [Patescibacteria group bacterium]|jgi:ribonuclease-3
MKDLARLEERLGVKFKNQDLLTQSLVHRSYLNEHPEFRLGHNERLEFLGDAVLELAVTRYLYEQYPAQTEGELTNWRASLVNSDKLAECAEELNINDFLYLSRGESKDSQSKARRYILANAYEAIIGAIYLDQGFEGAESFLHRELLPKLANILANQLYLDPKSRFQERSQEVVGVTPRYQVIAESGPDHDKRFEVGVFLNDERVATGIGASKQEAEEAAARKGLEVKSWL